MKYQLRNSYETNTVIRKVELTLLTQRVFVTLKEDTERKFENGL